MIVTKGTFCDKPYRELALESLADEKWSHRLFSSIKLHKGSYYLLQTCLNTLSEGVYLTQSATQNKVKLFPERTKVFKNSFFFHIVLKNEVKLNDNIRNIDLINKFRATILHFVKSKKN